ncbi:MAG: hypothetical protein GSR84_01110 [Desulfurococcales archaeon]|nr:hypothetical protein [Desulfurococcales archaeon]
MELTEFIAKYGERGYLVLRAIIEEADSNWGGPGLGDFSYKGVRNRLRSYGVEYNPAPLLSKLEKEYGVIETTYHSTSQHWWRILDREAIVEALRRHEGLPPAGEGGDDTRARLLRIQFYSLEPDKILETLKRLARGRRMSDADRRRLRRIVFEDLPLLVKFLEEAEGEYEDLLSREIALAHAILEAAERLVAPAGGRGAPRLRGVGEPLEYRSEAGLKDL